MTCGTKLGAMDHGAELEAVTCGVEPPPRQRYASNHAYAGLKPRRHGPQRPPRHQPPRSKNEIKTLRNLNVIFFFKKWANEQKIGPNSFIHKQCHKKVYIKFCCYKGSRATCCNRGSMDDHENMNNRHRLADDERMYVGFYYSNTQLGSNSRATHQRATTRPHARRRETPAPPRLASQEAVLCAYSHTPMHATVGLSNNRLMQS